MARVRRNESFCAQSAPVFEEEEPRGLFRVIEFAGATGILPEDVVDVFEGLFEHENLEAKLMEAKAGNSLKDTYSVKSGCGPQGCSAPVCRQELARCRSMRVLSGKHVRLIPAKIFHLTP